MDRWVPMCMIGAYGLRQGDGGLFWRLRGRVKVAYSRWFPRPSPVEPRSITAFSIAAVPAPPALALRALAAAFDWQIPVWPRPAERRVGKERVRTYNSRCSPNHYNKNK